MNLQAPGGAKQKSIAGSPLDSSRPLPGLSIQQRLPKDLQVIQYAVLARKVIVWVLSANDLQAVAVEISQEDLHEKIRDYVDKLSHYSGAESVAIATQATELFELLLTPVEQWLDPEKMICIVPDKGLNILPFETLISPATRNYFIEDFPISYAPSSSVLIACYEEAERKKEVAAERLLVVGNPRFDTALFSGLKDLPTATREAEKIAGYYPESVSLLEHKATERRLRGEMQNATVIHLAAHSILDKDSPLLSKILLTKEPAGSATDQDGVFESHEIGKAKLPHARLVVLSSCQSGIDR
jgi:CHAT domain-containing protein